MMGLFVQVGDISNLSSREKGYVKCLILRRQWLTTKIIEDNVERGDFNSYLAQEKAAIEWALRLIKTIKDETNEQN